MDYRKLLPAFEAMLKGCELKSVLEVGCNRGYNLRALQDLYACSLYGVEPNPYALARARELSEKFCLVEGSIYALPFRNSEMDLVLTSGVLIHIPLPRLSKALSELYRVSKRYLLSIEYYAEKETPIEYRGHQNLLWKRDFLSHYQTQFPTLQLIRQGKWEKEHGFDRVHWWLFQKRGFD